jgi:hypothetical protein
VEAITRQQVADRLDVPVVGIDGMIEAGELQYHEGPDRKILVDAEDIQVLKGAGDPPTVPSLSHIRAMMRLSFADCSTSKRGMVSWVKREDVEL